MTTTTPSMGSVDAAYRISERWQCEEINGVLLDATTARAIIAVAEKLSPENRAHMNALSIDKAANVAWKLVS